MPNVRDDLRLLEGYHSPQVDVAIRLNTNESPVAPPPAFTEALVAEITDLAWNRYPDRSAMALRSDLARLHHVEPSQVFAANGSNEVLQTLLLAYGGAGRTAMTFEPTYQLHAQIARITGTAVIEVERSADFRLDPVVATRAIAEHRPDVVFLCSPNNPTGLVETAEVVAAVLEAARGLVVIDEAYVQFAPWTALELVAEDRPLVVTRTFSKTWSLAAARLGYLIGPSDLVAELDKVVLPYHLDAVKQIAGRLILGFQAEMHAAVDAVIAERERLARAIADCGAYVVPSGANFILFRPTQGDAHDIWRELLDRGVLVRDCSQWPRLDGYLRVTIGQPEENDAFVEALREVLI